MHNAVIYARYSSDKQTEDSIEAQVRACKDYAAVKGYNIIEVYADEAISGKGSKTASRTQYQKMLRDCSKGTFDTILIHKYDRIAEKYTGVYVYSTKQEKNRADRRTKPNAIRIENALPIIIDKAQFNEVQKIMIERKQTGKKANYLCSGLVYCECGAKMHGMKSSKDGNIYHYFYCSKRCGAPVVRMEKVDNAAKEYLVTLLSDENQERISKAMREYKGSERERIEDFNTILKQKIEDKQQRYNNLLHNLSTGVLPDVVAADVGEEMKILKAEIECLQNTEPPKDYTVEQIKNWLESLKNSPDEAAIHLLIKRIDIKNKTEFNIQSTLNSVLGETCCGGWI